jgi:transposase-like protein
MNILPACPTLRVAEFSRPKCPRCGSTLLVAEESAFNPNGRIRHTWSCDDCGNEFVTSVRVFPRPMPIENAH